MRKTIGKYGIWNGGGLRSEDPSQRGERADIVYTFRRDNLRGTLQLEVLDLRPAE